MSEITTSEQARFALRKLEDRLDEHKEAIEASKEISDFYLFAEFIEENESKIPPLEKEIKEFKIKNSMYLI